jgi:hypothetical protein
MASQQEKAFCVLGVEVSRAESTVRREWRAWVITAGSAPFAAPAYCRAAGPSWKLAPWPRIKRDKRAAGSA